MDLFALGTPVVDLFARVDMKILAKLNAAKGATNYFSAREMAAIERKLGKRITYRYPGDNARNVCEGFSALGGFCGYQGAVGNDRAGSHFSANLQECGIADFLADKKGATGKIIALVTNDGQRTFCADLGVSTSCSAMERMALESSRLFFISSITLAKETPVAKLGMRYLEWCKKNGKKVAIALESPPMVGENRKLFLSIAEKYADYLFMNCDEAEALLGANAEGKLPALKPGMPVFLKKGKSGSLVIFNRKAHRVPALPAKVIDTTGAGDAYTAGVLYGISRGYTPQGSARIGCMLATKVVGKVGAGIPLSHTRIRIRRKQ